MEVRRSQESLHVLSQRLATVQEAERGHLAGELTDNITQSLVAMILRLQLLVNQLPAGNLAFRGEAIQLTKLVSETADEVKRISRKLRPSVLRDLGLVAALRSGSEEFMIRTGVRIEIHCARVSPRTSAEARMALYRIFEEALRNIEEHARAQHVIVRLTQRRDVVHLSIKDDGIGFDTALPPANQREKHRIGLLLMQQRAAFVGGVLTIQSKRRRGTEIRVRIPLPQGAQSID
jgi:two-component system NarL family sensor kinase